MAFAIVIRCSKRSQSTASLHQCCNALPSLICNKASFRVAPSFCFKTRVSAKAVDNNNNNNNNNSFYYYYYYYYYDTERFSYSFMALFNDYPNLKTKR